MFEPERRRAAERDRWFILDVSARWAPPGLQRGLTTEELAEFGDVIVVDLDEHREELAALGVLCVPARVVFTPAGPTQISAGLLSPAELRDWLTGLRANASFVAADQDPAPRIAALLALVSAGAAKHVGPELEAIWQSDLGLHARYDLIPLLRRACVAAAEVRERFVALRDATRPADSRGGVPNWLVLNEVLNDGQATLAWFDERVRAGLGVTPFSFLEKRILERGRAQDVLRLHPDLEATIESELGREPLFDDPESEQDLELEALMREEAHRDVALLVTASEAVVPANTTLRALALRLDPSPEMKSWLERSFEEVRSLCLAEHQNRSWNE